MLLAELAGVRARAEAEQGLAEDYEKELYLEEVHGCFARPTRVSTRDIFDDGERAGGGGGDVRRG